MSTVRTCQQILTNGHLCKCPALRTATLCYYHHRDLQRRRVLEKAREVQRSYDKHRESRPEEEFNAEVVEALEIPALDDRASIQVACTNLIRAVYCNHISLAKARVMMRAITEANLNLRRGATLDDFRQPVLERDPDPILPLGHSDPDGCVLPEQRALKQAIISGRRAEAERLDAEIAAARARGEDPPPRPLTPEEEKDAAREAQRAANDLKLLDFWKATLPNTEPGSPQRRHAESELAHLEARIATRKENHLAATRKENHLSATRKEPQLAAARVQHGFSRAPQHPSTQKTVSSRASCEGLLSNESSVAMNAARGKNPRASNCQANTESRILSEGAARVEGPDLPQGTPKTLLPQAAPAPVGASVSEVNSSQKR